MTVYGHFSIKSIYFVKFNLYDIILLDYIEKNIPFIVIFIYNLYILFGQNMVV